MSFNVIYNIIAQDKFSRTIRTAKSQFQALNKTISKFSKSLKDAGRAMAARLTLPLAIFGGVALKQAANLETLQVSLESMTGSTKKASALMKDLIKFTATTPFKLEGVGAATKTLLAFKVQQDEMIPTLRMLGDIAAGTNAPLTDIAQIFGKAKAKGKLMTEEILQLAERGIPIIDVLAEGFGVTKAQIFEMASKSQISFDVMQKALARTTAKGGVFFKQTEKQSQTLAGVYSTLQDNAGLALAEIGNQMVKVFNLKEKIKNFTASIGEWVITFKKFTEVNPFLTKLIFILTAIVAVAGPILVIIGAMASAIPVLITGFSALAIAVNAAALPVLAVAAALTAAWLIGTKIAEFLKGFPSLWNAIGRAVSIIINPIEEFSNLVKNIGNLSLVKDAIGLASGLFAGGVDVNANTNSKSTVDVNLNSPQGAVKSVKSRSDGNTKLNVGMNMVATAQ